VSPSSNKKELQTQTQNLIFTRCHFKNFHYRQFVWEKHNSTHWR